MSCVITVKNLHKQFGELTAVNDLSFTVPEGTVYGFLGQNGAGKSTTIRILQTLITPTSGTVEIFGMDLQKHRKEILRNTGAVIERPDLYKYLSAYENLRIFSLISGVKLSHNELMAQLAKVGLADRAQSKVKTYSQGMKQRLGIAVALANDPALIILDEPVNGLDPQGIADMRNLILHLSNDLKKTVFVSSHLLSEMEMIADNMLIIHKGKKVVEGKTTELLNPEEVNVELVVKNPADTVSFLQQSWAAAFTSVKDNMLHLTMKKSQVPQLAADLVHHQVEIESLRPVHSLEEYFLSLTR
jgi:ABC-type multidrug transport system ATPase subunit